VCVCVCEREYVCACVFACVYLGVSACLRVDEHIHAHVCVCVRVRVYVRVCTPDTSHNSVLANFTMGVTESDGCRADITYVLLGCYRNCVVDTSNG
jgi:hypothetical protein